MQEALIVGASGFLGRYVTNAMARSGYDVYGVGRSQERPYYLEDTITWIHGDARDLDFMTEIIRGKSVVLHLGGNGSPALANNAPLTSFIDGPLGSVTLMEACRIAGVERLIFASSGGTIYGPTDVVPTPEDHPSFGLGMYAVGKQVSEIYLKEFERLYGVKGFSLRISNPFGFGQRAAGGQGMIAYALESVRSRTAFNVYGDGKNIRDFIYAEDVADAFLACTVYSGEERVFNIGSGAGISIKEVLDVLDQHLSPHRVERVFAQSRSIDIPKSVLDISKAKRELRWEPTTSFSDGIKQTVSRFFSST